jgi:hypothetical protein
MNQRIDLDNLKVGAEPHDLGSWPYSRAKLEEMNQRYVAAMAAAIRTGLERPPRVGIDRTPGTKNPSHVPHGASTIGRVDRSIFRPTLPPA